MAVLAVYFAAHAALGSHGYQLSAAHGSTASPQHSALSHSAGGNLGECHDGEQPRDVSHPQCVAMPRAGESSSFDAMAALIVVVAASCSIVSPPRHRLAGGSVLSRSGRDVLRTLCVLRN